MKRRENIFTEVKEIKDRESRTEREYIKVIIAP